jgi:3-methyladenine DNA glycosylase AlkD
MALVAAVEAAVAAALEPARDAERAVSMSAYMRNQFPFLGIPLPAQRALVRPVLASLPRPNEADVDAVVRRLWARPEREYQYVGAGYAVRAINVCGPGFLATLEFAITTKSWWDTVDELASHAVGALVLPHPELVVRMDAWIDAPDFWLARTALLHQLRYKDRTDADRLFAYCRTRAADTEFFIRKAIGWALREYTKTDEAAVRRFLDEMGDRLSGLSRREALKWLDRRAARGV